MSLKCFLACSFHDEDRSVVEWFEKLLQIMGLDVRKGSTYPPDELIGTCDMLCALITCRGEGGVPPRVIQETAVANVLGLSIFAFVEEDVCRTNMGTLPEILTYCRFKREAILSLRPELLCLALTSGLAAFGKRLSAHCTRVTPDDGPFRIIERLLENLESCEMQLEPKDYPI